MKDWMITKKGSQTLKANKASKEVFFYFVQKSVQKFDHECDFIHIYMHKNDFVSVPQEFAEFFIVVHKIKSPLT